MKNDCINIRRGLDINVKGSAERQTASLLDEQLYGVSVDDYMGVVPKLSVAEGERVSAGTILFEDKHNAAARFVSPVSGVVKAVVRGEKRALLSVIVERDTEVQTSDSHEDTALPIPDAEDVIRMRMIETGLWTLLLQRPFGIVPPADARPKAIFVSAFDSSPLPVDIAYLLQGREADFQTGIDILCRLAPSLHLSLSENQRGSFLAQVKNATIHYFRGPHPAGLTGTQIGCIDPINKGECVWTVDPQDVAVIGHFFRTGQYCPERVVALCGPVVAHPRYYRLISGCSLRQMAAMVGDGNVRFIGSDILSGKRLDKDGFVGFRCNKVCVLREGDSYDFMGWLRPNLRKYSFSRTFLSGILNRLHLLPGRASSRFVIDTGLHGSRRPLFVTGEFEKLVPLNIYPMQLIKACIVGDIELMENLGIYEVEPEDLALCEFADTSKTEIQKIIREGLELARNL